VNRAACGVRRGEPCGVLRKSFLMERGEAGDET
jgi:hypothetical protein